MLVAKESMKRKFRIWDRYLKCMFYFDGLRVFHQQIGGKFDKLKKKNIKESVVCTSLLDTSKKFQDSGEWDTTEDSVLMFNIGLLNKEIYECDIVEVNHPCDYTGDFTKTLGYVFFQNDGCYAHVGHNGRPSKQMWEYCQVVGNEFQNPELMKKLNY